MPAYHPLPLDSLAEVCASACPLVLLDSATPGPEARRSYLFLSPESTLHTADAAEIPPLLEQLDHLSRVKWVAGFVAYEAGAALEKALHEEGGRGPVKSSSALAWFGVYEKPFIFDHRHGCWNYQPPTTDSARAHAPAHLELTDTLSLAQYRRHLTAIKRAIARGETYQVNFTFDRHVSTTAHPWAIYQRLRRAQPAPYSAFIRTENMVVLSFSPELFFSRGGRRVVTKPMKGTAARGVTPSQDRAICRGLAADSKNRAENVMIVDLLRNDLGRICEIGSVRVEELFVVESHPTVHQMTSTVSGRLRAGAGVGDIFKALFPCGSVTGAPKIQTMRIIRKLEREARGVYCGAIGFAAPRGRAVFSVPIRTLQRARGERRWHFRVGSGIVWDSRVADEWRECATKSAFLTAPALELHLIESLLWDGHYWYLNEHRARMDQSARYLHMPMSKRAFTQAAREVVCGLRGPHKVRLLLDRAGHFTAEVQPLKPHTTDSLPLVVPAAECIDATQPLLYHKTTYRPWYEEAMRLIRAGACFDVVFTNRRGRVTEGARSNIFARIDGTLYTPPVAEGLLGGVLREKLLQRGQCEERSLTLRDLVRAEALYCGNSVRGLVAVRLGES